jgi:hypothetical protein
VLTEDGSYYRVIAAAMGASEGSVRNALEDTEEPGTPTVLMLTSRRIRRAWSNARWREVSAEEDCPATI